VEYIATDNPGAAQRVGETLLDKFQSLKRFPFMGRMVPEWGQSEWRELIYLSYRLIYHVDERRKVVEAARIWHAARGEPRLY
jgi:plasmid stabilization system protein ParE